jgi:glycosyltransferase involved in cell wall biosynthesis
MNVTLDGIIFQLQSQGGISRLYRELLPRMCDLDPRLNIELLTPQCLAQDVPQHTQIAPHVVSTVAGSRLPAQVSTILNGLLRQQAIGTGRGRIWHSTYYTRPRIWKGMQVVMVMDMIQELYPALFPGPQEDAFRAIKRRCILDADIVISISETTRQDIHRLCGVDLQKIVAIPLACSAFFCELPDDAFLSTRKPFLLYVGRRSHNKNFAALAQAYAAWQDRSKMDMVVVGADWSEEEKALLTALGITETVHGVGSVDDRELSRLYRRAAAFVYPSLYEGFGIPLLEAMSCGCPVIASRIPSTVEVAGDCPIYFERDSLESFVSALETAESEGRETPRTIKAEKHVQRYSWTETAQQMLIVYRGLTA